MARLHRICLDCGAISPGSRCPDCTAKRYGGEYQRERAAIAPLVATGSLPCARCGGLIDGTWDLDHYAGRLKPSHSVCNRAADD